MPGVNHRRAVMVVLLFFVGVSLFWVSKSLWGVKACAAGEVCCAVPSGLKPIGWRRWGCRYSYECRVGGDCGWRCVTFEDPYGGSVPCCEYVTSGRCWGQGGGNNPPSCSINLSSPITYDAKEYLTAFRSRWQRRVIQPTTVQGTINTSDPDGDRVRITRMTVSKNQAV